MSAVPTHEEAVELALAQLRGHQWAFWPLDPALERLARRRIEARFGELFAETPEGHLPRWTVPAREVLITWPSSRQRSAISGSRQLSADRPSLIPEG